VKLQNPNWLWFCLVVAIEKDLRGSAKAGIEFGGDDESGDTFSDGVGGDELRTFAGTQRASDAGAGVRDSGCGRAGRGCGSGDARFDASDGMVFAVSPSIA